MSHSSRSKPSRRGRNGRTVSATPRSALRRCGFESLEVRTLMAADFAPDRILVGYRADASAAAREAVRALVAAPAVEHLFGNSGNAGPTAALDELKLPGTLSVNDAIQQLKNNPAVAYAEPDYLVKPALASNDPYYTAGYLWGMYGNTTSPANSFGSHAGEAWASGNVGSASVAVGIVDEGIDYTHPDLAANIWTNPGEIAGDGIDNDNDGYIDDIHGWDFANNDSTIFDGTPSDNVDHHGTHVAGTIGGVGGNGQGVAGMNWNVQMISAKFLGPTGGYTSNAVKAIDYLTMLKTKYGVNVVADNNSWGGGGFSQALQDAITRSAQANILFIAAAGNGGSDQVGDNNDVVANYPSNYSTAATAGYDNVVAVAAIDSSGGLASFSNYGALTVDLGAPGVSIVSTLPFGAYGAYSGTSMATPHVTGAVALYAAAHPGASAADIRSAIIASAQATPTASLAGKTATGGRLNVSAFPVFTPSLSVNDVSVQEGQSGTTSFTFTVKLSSASTQPVTVAYATADGTATAGSDYTAASGTLTFDPGVTSQQVTIGVTGDTTVENNETFFLNLSGASGATISDAQGQGTIVNDDFIVPALSINDVTKAEGDHGKTTFNFTVRLSSASNQTISVAYATADGTALASSDYRATSGSITFSPGVLSKTISVTVNPDSTSEADELFYVNLSSAVNATLANAKGTGTIVNDDGLTARAKATSVSDTDVDAGSVDYLLALLAADDSGKTRSR